MSGPLVMTAEDAECLSNFIKTLTSATIKTRVRVGAYGPIELRLPNKPDGSEGSVLAVRWDDDATQYVVDDRVGS